MDEDGDVRQEDEEDDLPRNQNAAKAEEEEADFERELAKLMSDSNPERSKSGASRIPGLSEFGLPFKRYGSHEGHEAQNESGNMTFTLLTKRGNKAQVSGDIPAFLNH